MEDLNVLELADLTALNTFGVEAQAQFLVSCRSLDSLRLMLKDIKDSNDPLLILGDGSNVLFTENYDGAIVLPQLPGIEQLASPGSHGIVRVGAGENWHRFVDYTLKQSLFGLENLALIPGTVGAAPIQNIGAYGVELREFVHAVEAVDLKTLESKRFNNEECRFGYRESRFKCESRGQYVITHVEFRLPREPSLNLSYAGIKEELEILKASTSNPSPRDVYKAISQLREKKLPDPLEYGNAGSFFKNPVVDAETAARISAEVSGFSYFPTGAQGKAKLSAAWLIEKAGLKGHSIGGAQVSRQHALVLINRKRATGAEIWQLAQFVMQTVRERFSVQLEPEPLIINRLGPMSFAK
jgi:UDP-N-acetylmuramate dehydrogenase